MAANQHRYRVHLVWTGGPGSASFRNHNRDYLLSSGDKPPISGSSDAIFRGNAARWNPEDLLVASLSACHMLTFIDTARHHGFVVDLYEDDAVGVLGRTAEGRRAITSVTLRPRIGFVGPQPSPDQLADLHHRAHEGCFIANSVRTVVTVAPADANAGA